jgi:hypothetical protein
MCTPLCMLIIKSRNQKNGNSPGNPCRCLYKNNLSFSGKKCPLFNHRERIHHKNRIAKVVNPLVKRQ